VDKYCENTLRINDVIEYKTVRSKRKTLSLQVVQGKVLVRAPNSLDEGFISSFIQKKSSWLKTKIAQQSQTDNLSCDFSEGSTLFLFGQLLTLHISFAQKASILITEDSNSKQLLTIVLAERNRKKFTDKALLATAVKKNIEQYFKAQAEKIIPLKVETYSNLTSLKPSAIKIRQYRSRWGSCNSRGELSFNYLLMMLPIDVIDYVVIHELCHLQHLNHSKDFWQLVAQYSPNYIQAKEWTKTNQSALIWRLP
jgi:predicted metal-dependent hydrolase